MSELICKDDPCEANAQKEDILAQLNVIELDDNAPIGIKTLYDFRKSKFWGKDFNWMNINPKHNNTIYYRSGVWEISTNVDLRLIYKAVMNMNRKKSTPQSNKPRTKEAINVFRFGRKAESLTEAIETGTVTFTPAYNFNK